jgi:hypothetical protein
MHAYDRHQLHHDLFIISLLHMNELLAIMLQNKTCYEMNGEHSMHIVLIERACFHSPTRS